METLETLESLENLEKLECWQKTGCVLCAQNCGLEVLVADGRMVKVRADKQNPRSQGYVCRKGLNILNYQYPKGRLTEPLKRIGDRFVPISWDQAASEIATGMRKLVDSHGPRCLAYMGASSQGGHFEAAFGLSLLRGMGSQYMYSSAGQEFSGAWWVAGRMLGKQYNVAIPDEKNTEMLVGWGWNGMQSHQMVQAPRTLRTIAKDPDKLLVVIDPRRSETAEISNIHLALCPGTDALLIKAMIALILERGWENSKYIEDHVEGFTEISSWFEGVDIEASLELCQLEFKQVEELCRLMTTRRWSMHPDLGIYMGRNSTLNSYLMNILAAICGVFCVKGGNVVPGMVMPLGFHADERSDKVWRTVTTNMAPVAAGAFPPAVMPEEILSQHPERLRAVFVNGCNPLRSYPDTTAYEEAFAKLDLLVVSDVVMSETARLANYVLPCRNGYESWDGTFFPWTYPEVYFQMRRPLVKPCGKSLEESQIFTMIADKLGLIPEIPANIYEAAKGNRLVFGAQLMEWAKKVPGVRRNMVLILAKTLGEEWDSANKAALWGMMMTAPHSFREQAARVGFTSGARQGEKIFQAILDNPQGLWLGKADDENPMAGLKTRSGKVEVYIPELAGQVKALDAVTESKAMKLPKKFPFILNAGRHMQCNANTLMRNPAWNDGKRACTVLMNHDDAVTHGLKDGQQVRVTTEVGTETGELEISERARQGTVLIPHGFGLDYDGTTYGINVNRLTKNTHRDPIGTPLHRYVPCRVESMG
ncbi:MAG: molybdopterin-dependent oxidoreductase [Desulfobulbaceae bacterium]|nr:molybdopterin-dependent oxidoreductase [Desulfobulbaceae bacterium]